MFARTARSGNSPSSWRFSVISPAPRLHRLARRRRHAVAAQQAHARR